MAKQDNPQGVVLTGLTGVGKSTVEKLLVEARVFRRPMTVVTRPIEGKEVSLYTSVTEIEFVQRQRAGDLVFPFRFGLVWYAYTVESWKAAVETEGRGWLFNVRPYVGLILASLLPHVTPVWLDLDEETRLERIEWREAQRDRDSSRVEQDSADRVYRELYPTVVSTLSTQAAALEILSRET
jgi:guanylate kinase